MAGDAGLRIAHYDWAGGREAMLRFGPDAGVTVVAALPLFEEGNRTRAAVVDVVRRLAEVGIAGALPDLPGAGESLVPTRDATLAMWREAFAAACGTIGRPVHVMGWRGGALVDGEADVASRWYLAPLSGTSVLRELARLRAAGGGEDFGGNVLSAAMLDGLAGAEPVTADALRVVRLESDPKAADRKVAGVPLWRGSEPGVDAALQAAVAEDVAAWVRG